NSVFYVSPDTAHEFLTWRRSLREFAPLLFREWAPDRSVGEEVQLEQHVARLRRDYLPQVERRDEVLLVLGAHLVEPALHFLVAGAAQRDVVQRTGQAARLHLAVVGAVAVERVDVDDRAILGV